MSVLSKAPMFCLHEVERRYTLAQSTVACVYRKTAATLKSPFFFNLSHEIF
jgi:hypothetical protein